MRHRLGFQIESRMLGISSCGEPSSSQELEVNLEAINAELIALA